MIPVYVFYSMFGFQRTGDSIWAAADQMARGFLIGATAGRTTLTGEGLQHNDGHSLLLAATNPAVRRLRPGVLLRDRAHRRATACAGCTASRDDGTLGGENVFYYLTVYNEPYRAAGRAGGPGRRGPAARDLPLRGRAAARTARRSGCSPPASRCRGRCRPSELLAEQWGVGAEVWSVTSWGELRRDGVECERHNLLHPDGGAAGAVRDAGARRGDGARWSRCRTGCGRCPT